MEIVLNDEPSPEDKLGREPYAKALAAMVIKCETPFTIGIYGDWGAGKTTLLKLIQRQVESPDVKCVWFNAWVHQQNENPALALMHSIANELKLNTEVKKILTVVGSTLANTLLKITTQISAEDIKKTAEAYEEEQFLIRDQRTRLREKFQEFVSIVRGKNSARLVIFIDDLDRCDATQALSVLEALKLYMNLDGCVFVLAADRLALERAVEQKYGSSFIGNSKYLDKIVQLPFVLPPIHPQSIERYVQDHLGANFEECTNLMVAGLGANPRALKRFVNILNLNDELASDLDFDEYDVRWLCIVLLIQHLDPNKYLLLSTNDAALESFLEKKAHETDPRLKAVFELAGSPPASIGPYIHLANVSTDISSAEDVEHLEKNLFMTPLKPSVELAKIVGEKPLPRTEIVSKLWVYIQKNGLQDKTNKRMVNSDELLREVFGKDQVSMFEMAGLINKHATQVETNPL